MANRTTQDMRISIENGLVTISTGTGQAQVPADQIDYIVNALKAAQMLVGIAPPATQAMMMPSTPAAPRQPAPAPVAPVAAPKAAAPKAAAPKAAAPKAAAPKAAAPKAAAPKAAAPKAVAKAAAAPKIAAVETVAPVVVPKRRGRPPKNPGPDGQSLTKRRSRKRVGDALEAWIRKNPGWYTEGELLDLVKREEMTDAEPNRALKIALGKQKDVLFITDAAGRWSLVGLDTSSAKAQQAQPAKDAGKATKPAAAAKRATPVRKRQATAGAGKKSDQESSPVAETKTAAAPVKDQDDSATTATAAKPLRVKKGEKRDDVLQAGRKSSAAAAHPSATWPTTQQDRERIRRNLFGE